MRRLVFYSPVLLLTLSIGLFFGFLGWNSDGERPPESPKQYDFFADAPVPSEFPYKLIPTKQIRQPLTCSDRKILPIWTVLLKDERIFETEYYPDESYDCSKIVQVHYADLNSDGTAEILVRGVIVPLCGGVGNCAFWIFQKVGKQYRILLNASDYIDRSKLGEQILRARTNGYSDILLRGHFSAAHTGFYYLKFDGRKYRDSKCLYEVPDYGSEDYLHWKFITCDQFTHEQGP